MQIKVCGEIRRHQSSSPPESKHSLGRKKSLPDFRGNVAHCGETKSSTRERVTYRNYYRDLPQHIVSLF